jgi:hypothetical protein
MPWFNGYPYTSFRGVNSKDGRIRFQDPNLTYGARIEIDNNTLTDDRKVYLCDGNGSLTVRGYHITYGSGTYQNNSNIAANTIYTATMAITGVLTTSIIFCSVNGMSGTAAVSGYPIGAKCTTAGVASLVMLSGATTAAAGTVALDYVFFNPQTT